VKKGSAFRLLQKKICLTVIKSNISSIEGPKGKICLAATRCIYLVLSEGENDYPPFNSWVACKLIEGKCPGNVDDCSKDNDIDFMDKTGPGKTSSRAKAQEKLTPHGASFK